MLRHYGAIKMHYCYYIPKSLRLNSISNLSKAHVTRDSISANTWKIAVQRATEDSLKPGGQNSNNKNLSFMLQISYALTYLVLVYLY